MWAARYNRHVAAVKRHLKSRAIDIGPQINGKRRQQFYRVHATGPHRRAEIVQALTEYYGTPTDRSGALLFAKQEDEVVAWLSPNGELAFEGDHYGNLSALR